MLDLCHMMKALTWASRILKRKKKKADVLYQKGIEHSRFSFLGLS